MIVLLLLQLLQTPVMAQIQPGDSVVYDVIVTAMLANGEVKSEPQSDEVTLLSVQSAFGAATVLEISRDKDGNVLNKETKSVPMLSEPYEAAKACGPFKNGQFASTESPAGTYDTCQSLFTRPDGSTVEEYLGNVLFQIVKAKIRDPSKGITKEYLLRKIKTPSADSAKGVSIFLQQRS